MVFVLATIRRCGTNSPIYQDALALRRAVFIEEQGVAESDERDGDDENCRHFVLYHADNRPIATARLKLHRQDKHAIIQRVAVQKNARQQYAGTAIMQALEEYAKKQGITRLSLSAQLPSLAFYQKLGYAPQGEPYLDAGILHQRMEKAG